MLLPSVLVASCWIYAYSPVALLCRNCKPTPTPWVTEGSDKTFGQLPISCLLRQIFQYLVRLQVLCEQLAELSTNTGLAYDATPVAAFRLSSIVAFVGGIMVLPMQLGGGLSSRRLRS